MNKPGMGLCETMFGMQLAINEPRMNLLCDHIWGVIAY